MARESEPTAGQRQHEVHMVLSSRTHPTAGYNRASSEQGTRDRRNGLSIATCTLRRTLTENAGELGLSSSLTSAAVVVRALVASLLSLEMGQRLVLSYALAVREHALLGVSPGQDNQLGLSPLPPVL